MSREELADIVNQLIDKHVHDGPVTANHIGKIERGVSSWPPAHRRAAYRAALQVVSDADIGLVNRRRRPADERPLSPVADQTDSGAAATSGSEDINRRTLMFGALAKSGMLALVSSTATEDDLTHLNAAVNNARRYLDLEVIEYLRDRLSACAAIDGTNGPAAALPIALGVIAVITNRARDVREGVRRELLTVGSRGAELAGWLYRDAGSPELADYWRDRAAAWAIEAGDFAMPGYILIKKSQAAWDERNAPRMLDLMQTVRGGPWNLPLAVRAEAAQQEARAHAMLTRDNRMAQQFLDRAQEFMAARQLALLEDPCRHFDKSLLAVQTAMCYAEMGRVEDAVEQYNTALSPTAFSRRDYGYFLALNAQVLTRVGQVDQAANAGQTAHAVASSSGSIRTLNELKRLRGQLQPWEGRSTVQSFSRCLSASRSPM